MKKTFYSQTLDPDSTPPKISRGTPYFDKSKKTPLDPGNPELQYPRPPYFTKSENLQYPTTFSHSFPIPISATHEDISLFPLLPLLPIILFLSELNVFKLDLGPRPVLIPDRVWR